MLDKRQINDKFTFPYMGMSALKTMKVLNLVCYFCVFFFYLHIKTAKRTCTKMKTQTTNTHEINQLHLPQIQEQLRVHPHLSDKERILHTCVCLKASLQYVPLFLVSISFHQ